MRRSREHLVKRDGFSEKQSGNHVSNASKLGRHAFQGRQVDETSALAALGGNEDLLKELGTMFCEDAPQVLGELEQAVAAGDLAAARLAAHSLKGLA